MFFLLEIIINVFYWNIIYDDSKIFNWIRSLLKLNQNIQRCINEVALSFYSLKIEYLNKDKINKDIDNFLWIFD